jgi:hypothetical protein
VANALYAGFVTALAMALFYVVIRLVFIYGDGGSLPDGTSLDCQAGPDCVYQRLLIQEQESGTSGELASSAASAVLYPHNREAPSRDK